MTAFIESSAQSDTANLELTSHDYDLPVDIVEGELILSIIALGANGKDPKITAVDNGWQILREISDNSVNFAVLGKVASAGEVGPANLTTDVACVTAHITHRISGWAGGLSCVVVSPGFSQKSLEPNPDLVEAGWDLTDNLFIVGTTAHRNSSVLTYPTGYVDNQISFSTGGGGNETMVATASQDIDSTFDNPDVFTILSSFWHIAVTIVVGPAGACEIVTFNSAYPIRQQLRRAMFHSYLLEPEHTRAEEIVINDAITTLGGTALTAPVDGVTATPGYTITRTLEIFNAAIERVREPHASEAIALIVAALTDRGWT